MIAQNVLNFRSWSFVFSSSSVWGWGWWLSWLKSGWIRNWRDFCKWLKLSAVFVDVSWSNNDHRLKTALALCQPEWKEITCSRCGLVINLLHILSFFVLPVMNATVAVLKVSCCMLHHSKVNMCRCPLSLILHAWHLICFCFLVRYCFQTLVGFFSVFFLLWDMQTVYKLYKLADCSSWLERVCDYADTVYSFCKPNYSVYEN